MKFSKEDLLELLYSGTTSRPMKIVENKITENTRWSVCFDLIFECDGKFYKTDYSKGATESQEESPFQYADEMIECDEVVPVQKTITVYEKKI